LVFIELAEAKTVKNRVLADPEGNEFCLERGE